MLRRSVGTCDYLRDGGVAPHAARRFRPDGACPFSTRLGRRSALTPHTLPCGSKGEEQPILTWAQVGVVRSKSNLDFQPVQKFVPN